MAKLSRVFCLGGLGLLIVILIYSVVMAEDELAVIETVSEDNSAAASDQESVEIVKVPETVLENKYEDPVRYTLGPNDVVEIAVLRHPEFSGVYPVNEEGKIQYKFVGDLEITGLTKKKLEEKITEIISSYVINPEVNVTILEYRSKVIYILGEVGTPGRFYMKSETIPVREAVVNAGLPTLSAAMRKCRIVTPSNDGNAKRKFVDLYSILYAGNLKNNVDMHPGEVLYVPATVMAKVIRVISPVATTMGVAASTPSSVSSGKTSATSLAR